VTDTPPAPTAHGTHDPRNAQVLVDVNGRLVPRRQAVVSVFDRKLARHRAALEAGAAP
jgi:hypothetical protein